MARPTPTILLRLVQRSDNRWGASGARRSRRFNVRTNSGLGLRCASSRLTRKRAEARAPSLDCTSLNSGRLKTSVRLQNGKPMEQTSWPDVEHQGAGIVAILK